VNSVPAGEPVRLVDAGDAEDELADLLAVGAAVGTGEAGEDAADLWFGGRAGIAAGSHPHEGIEIESR
jgi:hypothetical protein